MTTPTVLIAGASGDIGSRIVRELRASDVNLRLLTRPGGARHPSLSDSPDAVVVESAYDDEAGLRRALAGVDVVVSAVSGARPVIVDAQLALLRAAVAEGVRRFIPSDYAADYRRIPPRTNRNFELRREFAAHLDAAPIRATSILNGAFTDMLTGQAPIVVPRIRRVLFWSDPDQVLDFTSKDDTARFVARAALDETAPRFLEIAGDRVTARSLAETMTRVTGEVYRPLFAGTTGSLSLMARTLRATSKEDAQAFPAWQGMQYLVSMYSGDAALQHVDNDRYGVERWTTAEDVLEAHFRR